jgi:hypothetical protein
VGIYLGLNEKRLSGGLSLNLNKFTHQEKYLIDLN